MNAPETSEFVKGLGEVEYGVLKATYCKLQEVRSRVDAIHDVYVTSGTAPGLDEVQGLRLLVGDLYDDLERFLLPLCAETACDPSLCVNG
jgi:hypothetical protein